MKSFEERYSILNPQQKKAVDTTDGPVFVMAGPGTGKTQILTLRIANILKEIDGIEPEQILALTFTNAASYNMKERLSEFTGASVAHRVHISTFHSFAEDMIKKYSDYFDRFANARLISQVEQIVLLTELADTYGGKSFSSFKRREGTISGILFQIGKVKAETLSPESLRDDIQASFEEDAQSPDMFYKRASGENKKGDIKQHKLRTLEKRRDKSLAFVDIYEQYQKALLEKKLYDYNDLISSVVEELRNDSDFQAELQEQFQYILVDEHQDTNDGQNKILHALIDNPVWEGKPNIFVVGDSKQSIFRFAGASQESFTELFEHLKEVTTISLEENYRSDQLILDHAHDLISHSEHHQDEVKLNAFSSFDSSFEYREFDSYKTELLWVAQDIQKRIEKGEDPCEIAVLFRNNKDINDLYPLLGAYGIPYQDYTKKNLLEDIDIKKLFLLLRCVSEHTDNDMVAKALFINFLDFNIIDVQKILKAFRMQRSNETLFEMLSDTKKLIAEGISEDKAKRYQEFVNMILELKSVAHNTDFVSFFSQALRDTGFLNYMLSQENSALALAKIETLFDEVKKEQMSQESFGIDEFINYLNILNEHTVSLNVKAVRAKGIQLMTFHGSKGLEFETVYIIKALKKSKRGSDIHLPLLNFSDGDAEDERRLLYVALTRAKKNCLISSYVYNHDGKEQSRSLYIDELKNLSHIDMETWEQEHALDLADFFAKPQEFAQSLIDQEYIKERFTKSSLSVSALNNYVESPLVYFFRNLVLIPQARNQFLDFGNLAHETLEKFYEASVKHKEVLSKEKLLEILVDVAQNKVNYLPYLEKAQETLSSYADARLEGEVLPVETEFRVNGVSFETEDGYELRLNGVIDKITQGEDGSVVVWDYKTGKAYSDMDKSRREKLKRQAVFYKMLLGSYQGGKYNPTKVVFDFLEPSSKTGEYERHEIEVTTEDVREVHDLINQLVKDIFEGTLLSRSYQSSIASKEYEELLEIIKGPRSYEQQTLL